MSSSTTHLPAVNRFVSPTDIAAALVGPSITIHGITRPQRLPSWLPSADVLAAQDGQDPIVVNKVSKYSKAVGQLIALFLITLVVLAIGASLGRAASESVLAWEVKAISKDGLIVSTAGHTEVLSIGMMLPNGERILSIDAKKGRYITNRMEVTILATPKNE